jgi:hypothetical protein
LTNQGAAFIERGLAGSKDDTSCSDLYDLGIAGRRPQGRRVQTPYWRILVAAHVRLLESETLEHASLYLAMFSSPPWPMFSINGRRGLAREMFASGAGVV